MIDFGIYSGLFGISFLAATILPAQSEVGLAALVAHGMHPVIGLIAVASAGNSLGAVVNWGLGRAVTKFQGKSWFPVSPDRLERASAWYRRYGRWSLLLSWVPIIGDPLTVAAGVLREGFWAFLALVVIAKTGRYIVVAAVALEFF